MKKLIFIGLLFSYMSVFSQNFPGKDVELLVGKEIKVLEKAESLQQYGYDDFYKDSNLKKKYACCESYNSKYKELVNKVFKVLSYEAYTNSIGIEKYKLQIENPETGIIYFDYSSEYEHAFPFEVIGGIDFPEGYFCKYIEERKDKFTEKVTYSTPILEPISFIKDKGESIIYMRITVGGSTPNVNKKGVIMLLDNGEKIELPDEKIDVKVSSGSGYTYTAFISLKATEIEKLAQHSVTDVRLYIYDSTIKNGKKYQEFLKCIKDK